MLLVEILLLLSLIIFSCVLLSRISSRIGVPSLLAFILLGMFFGADGPLAINFDNFELVRDVCTFALVFIMFYGGFSTNWRQARPVAVKAFLLSSLGVVLTAALVGLFCHFVLGLELVASLLLGSVISSTDAASVFFVLRSRRLHLRDNTASLLEVESGSNDPCAYMLTAACIAFMQGGASAGGIARMLFAQIVYGLILGGLIALSVRWLMQRMKINVDGFDAILMVGVALFAYAAPEAVGGNGYLSAYVVGLILGNTGSYGKKHLFGFFDGFTGLMQMGVFFLLGLLSFPSALVHWTLPGLGVALFLTFVARPLAVALLLTPLRSSLAQQMVVSWAGLRGAASIVFAIMALMAANIEQGLFDVVFVIVLFSILLQGSLLPWVAGKLDMIDAGGDVMKTFTDYSEEEPVQFIQFKIPDGHPWSGQLLREVRLPPGTLVVLLKRDGKNIIPNGETPLLAGDSVILSAASPTTVAGIHLSEVRLDNSSAWCGKTLAELPREKNSLIIMVRRSKRILIPNGQTRLAAGDVLVLTRLE